MENNYTYSSIMGEPAFSIYKEACKYEKLEFDVKIHDPENIEVFVHYNNEIQLFYLGIRYGELLKEHHLNNANH